MCLRCTHLSASFTLQLRPVPSLLPFLAVFAKYRARPALSWIRSRTSSELRRTIQAETITSLPLQQCTKNSPAMKKASGWDESHKSQEFLKLLCSNLTSKATLDILTATFVCPGTCTALHASPARFRWHHSVPNTHPARWSHPYKIQKQQQYLNFGIISESIPEVRGRLSDRVDIGPLPRDCSALLADPSAAQQAFQQVTCIHLKWPAMADAAWSTK